MKLTSIPRRISDRRDGRGARVYGAWLLALILLVAAAVPRIVLATHPGLWVDEIFSLAIATGHSLEHPAAVARPALGDFVQPRDAVSGAVFRSYTQHDTTLAGEPGRVVRAVFLSDTSPPLYYVLLSGWTRAFGTSDAALRLFSAVCSIICFPLLWLIGRHVGGPDGRSSTGWIACALFAASPLALYYAAEGRMYALTWLLGLLLVWATLELQRRGPRPIALSLWVIAGAAGLLTHYFFAFVWIVAAAWLWMNEGGIQRKHVIAAAVVTGLLVLPWYLQVPASLHQWRVTDGWLNHRLLLRQIATAPFLFVWSMLSGNGIWGVSRRAPWLAGALYTLLVVVALRRGLSRLFSPPQTLLWLWLAASVTGPVVFDVLRGTNASLIERYALPGLPAAIMIVAVGVNLLPQVAQVAFVALLLTAWSPGMRDVFSLPSRPWEPYPVVAGELDDWTRSAPAPGSDVVIVQSIPSGVIGIARYLRARVPLASWVVQLGQRHAAADMRALTAGRCRVALVQIHFLDLASPAQAWLHQNASLERRHHINVNTDIQYYALTTPLDTSGAVPQCARLPAAGSRLQYPFRDRATAADASVRARSRESFPSSPARRRSGG